MEVNLFDKLRIDAEHSRGIKPRLIIGLGNPGKEYETTYHNVGFLAIDFLNSDSKPQIHPNLQILKSEVYMNQSGNFVKKILKKYKAKPEEILIVHDDSDIELGKYKISFGRGSAGHNGVQSIIDALKTKNFRRLRIGIGKTLKTTKAGEFVLKKIGKHDLKILEAVFRSASAIFEKKPWKD
ncbi:aminoacyl-tRNA hydrolase [Candidatus Wolfebacteria bacterium]|nr:aminoacyl-tRNA hydrolase [Candidatus Wolfebacteria bacterium]